MKLELHGGKKVKVAHLIPSRGRAELMMKSMPKMQEVWNRPDTFIAIDKSEKKDYAGVVAHLPKAEFIWYRNPDACVGKALDVLRKESTDIGYDYYVMSDDNCRFTNDAFHTLVRATAEWPKPVHMAGAHPTAAFFDKGRIRRSLVDMNGIKSYRKMAWIFRCVPHEMYEPFKYPHDLPCYADRYFSMWLITHGYLEFRATPDAPFDKRRFVDGGIGTKESRGRSAIGLSMMARDFAPTWGHLEVRIPWEEIIKLNQPKLRLKLK